MYYLFMLCTLLINTVANAEIIEIQNIEEALPYIDHSSFVLLDLDNTLINLPQELGNDQWARYRWQQLLDKGIDPEEVKEQILREWRSVQQLSQVVPVEPNTAETVRQIQNSAETTIGLTTRGIGMATTSIYQLKTIGVNLLPSSHWKNDLYFWNEQGVLFRNGVLFTSGTHKGDAIEKVWKLTNTYPQKVIFINDKHSHLLPVEETCQKLGIPFIGLRYGYLDEKVRAFRPEIAEIQWKKFAIILSDEEASKQLN